MVERIQRKRTKGWRMPPNTVSVCRPGKWGNPWKATDAAKAGYGDGHAMAVHAFRQWLRGDPEWVAGENLHRRQSILNDIAELRGANLACFCPLDKPCHADVLIELANDGVVGEGKQP